MFPTKINQFLYTEMKDLLSPFSRLNRKKAVIIMSSSNTQQKKGLKTVTPTPPVLSWASSLPLHAVSASGLRAPLLHFILLSMGAL